MTPFSIPAIGKIFAYTALATLSFGCINTARYLLRKDHNYSENATIITDIQRSNSNPNKYRMITAPGDTFTVFSNAKHANTGISTKYGLNAKDSDLIKTYNTQDNGLMGKRKFQENIPLALAKKRRNEWGYALMTGDRVQIVPYNTDRDGNDFRQPGF